MDWATEAIMAVVLLILGIWIIIPINEFKEILAKVRHRPGQGGAEGSRYEVVDDDSRSGRGFDVKQPPPPIGPDRGPEEHKP